MATDDIKILVEDLRKERETLEKKEAALKSREAELVTRLEKASSMTADEAKKVLLEEVQSQLTSEIAQKIRKAEERIKEDANEKAKEILADAMLHGVTDYISEFTTSRVKLPDLEMKGRIIGKEGRNVRTFEQATGVDLVMDDENGRAVAFLAPDSGG